MFAVTDVEAELLAGFGSRLAEVAVADTVIWDRSGVEHASVDTREIVALEPAASDAKVTMGDPEVPPQTPPPVAEQFVSCRADGSVTATVMFVAGCGPALETTTEAVTREPVTGFGGDAAIETPRSASGSAAQ